MRTSLIALLRRDKALLDATNHAKELLSYSENHRPPESAEVRDAARELAHVYMDTGEFEEARELCFRRTGPIVEETDGRRHFRIYDSRAVWAVEDLAEIEKRECHPENEVKLLVEAAYMSIDNRGSRIAIPHIADKIENAS